MALLRGYIPGHSLYLQYGGMGTNCAGFSITPTPLGSHRLCQTQREGAGREMERRGETEKEERQRRGNGRGERKREETEEGGGRWGKKRRPGDGGKEGMGSDGGTRGASSGQGAGRETTV